MNKQVFVIKWGKAEGANGTYPLYAVSESWSGETQGQKHFYHRGTQKNSCIVYSLDSTPPAILPWKCWILFIIPDHTWPELMSNLPHSYYS